MTSTPSSLPIQVGGGSQLPEDEPDYVLWAASTALTHHAIACLFLGVNPNAREPSDSDRLGRAPAMPDDVRDRVDLAEWERDYRRIYVTLKEALTAREVSTDNSGRTHLDNALRFLAGKARLGGWIDDVTEHPFYKAWSSQAGTSACLPEQHIRELEAQLVEAQATITRLKQRSAYRTNLLAWLDEVIDQYFFEGYDTPPTSEEIVNFVIRSSKANGQPVSPSAAKAIATILTPEDRRRGGRRPGKVRTD